MSVARRERSKGLVPYAADSEVRIVGTGPTWPAGLTARPAEETWGWVLATMGARAWDRDAIDRRLIEETRRGGGRIIDHESEVGGLPGPSP